MKRVVSNGLVHLRGALESGQFLGNTMTEEEGESIKKITDNYIRLVKVMLNDMKPIRDDLENINRQAKLFVDNSRMYDYRITQVMESVYKHSRDSRNQVEKIARDIMDSSKSGELHDIIMANSLVKSSSETVNKDQGRRNLFH
jgi:hypothetical protein